MVSKYPAGIESLQSGSTDIEAVQIGDQKDGRLLGIYLFKFPVELFF